MVRLTVLQLLPALESGGVERGTIDIARALVSHGHRAIVISAGGRMVDELVKAGAEHLTRPVGRKSPAVIFEVFRLREWLRRNPVDIVHARSRLPAWVALMALRGLPSIARPRFVTTVHGAYSVSRYSAVMTRGERVIAISDYIQDYIRAHYPAVPPERIAVIYRGIDRVRYAQDFRPGDEWRHRWHEQFPHLQEKQLVTLPARITRRKGHEDFISLIKLLRPQNPAIHGLIVGGSGNRRTPYFDEIVQRIRAEGLEHHLTLTGHRADVREIMAVSTLVVTLSNKPEAFGRTTLEALSLGIPVIGYDHGGTRELLTKLYPAGRVETGNVLALAAVVERHLADHPRVPAFSGFTLEEMTDRTLDLYADLMARHP